MATLFDYARSQQPSTWTVSDLTRYIRDLFEMDYRLQEVQVEGEISNFVRARSGHLYFTLKDKESQIKCVMWRNSAERLRFRPRDGDQISAEGRISVYEASGVYQLYANRLTPAGRGNLALAFERLKEQLTAEGLFNPEFKQPIPQFPRKIGIVTSADAAALRDILNVLRRRYPLVEVLIAPTLVQGTSAPPQIVRAIRWLDSRDDIDTIIVARGGGSIEDLWAFNNEDVARTVFNCQHPVISGVGHETDFTIVDFVADLRAPTPSAAAEVATPDLSEIQPYVIGLRQALRQTMLDKLEQSSWQVDSLKRMLGSLSPQNLVHNSEQRVDELSLRLDNAMRRHIDQQQSRVAVAQAQLLAVSPLATLARGYAIVRDVNGAVVRSSQQVDSGESLTVQVADGAFDVTVSDRD